MRLGAQRRLLTGWGRGTATGADVVIPVDRAMVEAAASEVPARGVLARGLGRSYGDAAQNAGGRVLDMTSLQGVHEFSPDSGLLTASSGLVLHDLMQRVVPLGWFPHVTPGTRQVTLGGALAADIHGKNHHRDGSWANGVRSFELVTPDGDGQPVTQQVTREDSPEVFRATLGGMGLTGIVTQQTLQLQQIPSSRLVVDTERARDLDDLLARMTDHDDDYRFSVAWIDCLARGAQLGRSVLTRGDWAQPDDLPVDQINSPHGFNSAPLLTAPPWAPSGLLNPLTVSAFNELWFRLAPTHRTGEIQSIGAFFHPLDSIRDWNRIYGRAGFLQYQFVVPFGAEDVLRTIVEILAGLRIASFLAVLKRFGPGNDALLSFPMPGWTLALDIPLGDDRLEATLRHFDHLVAEAGGRIYLAKDSCLTPGLLPVMYPKLDRWRSIQTDLDPHGVLTSDLNRRLDLTGRGAAR